MSNLWQRIAKFFTEWDGEDMTKTMPLSVEDLRLINSQRIMLTTLERERKEIRNKTIDEFVKRLYKIGEHREFDWEDIYKLADQMKGGVIDG